MGAHQAVLTNCHLHNVKKNIYTIYRFSKDSHLAPWKKNTDEAEPWEPSGPARLSPITTRPHVQATYLPTKIKPNIIQVSHTRLRSCTCV